LALKGIGNIQLPTNYVFNTSYDEAGRARLRQLGVNGSAGIVQEQYTYYAWNAANQGGRLQSIQANSTMVPPTALLNLSYAYNANGNVLSINDAIMGGPQTQSFGYDSLNRLTSAGASGGSQGNYGPESYNYDLTTGNLASKAGAGYTYGAQNGNCPDGALSKAHAVVTAGANTYCYDRNGNMVRRNIGANTYNLTYDAENRLTQVSGAAVASFGYDGDGQRVIGVEGGTTTVYIGNYFEWKGSTSTMVKYYYAGTERVAMKTGAEDPKWLVGDHLGSTSVVANYDGTVFINGITPARQGYKAWGEQRFPDPLSGSPLPTTFRYTGQRESASFGLYFYGARWYDNTLGRFTSPDTDVPESQGVQGWDRYGYVNNNPLVYKDPNGHFAFLAALALIGPVGWIAIGVTVLAVGVYFAVPGVRQAVTAAIEEAGEAVSDALDSGSSESEASDKPDTTKPGPYAGDSIEARSPDRDFTEEEREAIDAIGQATGCHSCGTKNPGTKSGHFIPDHQPPSALNPSRLPQRLYPHCLSCSRKQGGQITGTLSGGGLQIPFTITFDYQY
jgi:RHS repeat-associated protein